MEKWMCLLLFAVAGCGSSSRDNQLIGQVKKVQHNTPIICGDYVDADVSLGVLRNGVGSMSTQDMWLNAANAVDITLMEAAAKAGNVVHITYDTKRFVFCSYSDKFVTKIEIED